MKLWGEDTDGESYLQEWNFLELVYAAVGLTLDAEAWKSRNIRDREDNRALHVLRWVESSRNRRLFTQSLILGGCSQAVGQGSVIPTDCQCLKVLLTSAGAKDVWWAHYVSEVGYIQEVGRSITWDGFWSKWGWASWLDCARPFLCNAVRKWWRIFAWLLSYREWVTSGCDQNKMEFNQMGLQITHLIFSCTVSWKLTCWELSNMVRSFPYIVVLRPNFIQTNARTVKRHKPHESLEALL